MNLYRFTLLAKYAFLFLIQTKSYVVIALSVITHLSLRFYLAALSIVHIFLHSLVRIEFCARFKQCSAESFYLMFWNLVKINLWLIIVHSDTTLHRLHNIQQALKVVS